MTFHKSLSLFFVAALSATAAFAEIPDSVLTMADVTAAPEMAMPKTWSFDDCLAWAKANTTDVRRNMLNLLLADQNIGEAKDAWLPSVGFSTNQSFTNYPSPEEGRTANGYGSSYGINASWTVWEGNVRKYRLESAKILKQQQQLAGDDIVKNLELGILQAYLNILYASEAVTIAQQTLEVSTSQTDRAKRLMESGRTSRVEYAQIKSQKAQDEYNLVQAQSNYASAKMTLKSILQLSLDYDLNIVETAFPDADVITPLPPKNDVFNYAALWLPEIKSNDLNKEIYDYDLKIAKAGYAPQIALTGGIGTGYASGGNSWGKQMGHGFNENIGVNLSVPIYDGNATKRAVTKAKLAALEYDLNRKDLLDNLTQTIENLYIDADNARAKYVAGKVQLEATTLTAELVNRQFEIGYVNPLDLLSAHNNLLNARLELLQSKFMAILANKTINYYATAQVTIPDTAAIDIPDDGSHSSHATHNARHEAHKIPSLSHIE